MHSGLAVESTYPDCIKNAQIFSSSAFILFVNQCTAVLEDVDPNNFGSMASWMHTRDLEEYDVDTNPSGTAGSGTARQGREILRLGKLWILAQRFITPALQSQAMVAICHQIRTSMVKDLVPFYRLIDTNGTDLLIKLAMENFVYCFGSRNFDQMIELLPI